MSNFLNKKQREWLEENFHSTHQTVYDMERSFNKIQYGEFDEYSEDDLYDNILGYFKELSEMYDNLHYLGEEYE